MTAWAAWAASIGVFVAGIPQLFEIVAFPDVASLEDRATASAIGILINENAGNMDRGAGLHSWRPIVLDHHDKLGEVQAEMKFVIFAWTDGEYAAVEDFLRSNIVEKGAILDDIGLNGALNHLGAQVADVRDDAGYALAAIISAGEHLSDDQPWAMGRDQSAMLIATNDDQTARETCQDPSENCGSDSREGDDPVSRSNWFGLRLFVGIFGGAAIFTAGLFVGGFGDDEIGRLSWWRRGLGIGLGLAGLGVIGYGVFWNMWTVGA